MRLALLALCAIGLSACTDPIQKEKRDLAACVRDAQRSFALVSDTSDRNRRIADNVFECMHALGYVDAMDRKMCPLAYSITPAGKTDIFCYDPV